VRRLTLTEFQTKEAVCLSAIERDEIRRLDPGIRVEPTRSLEGHYDLTPDQKIGVIYLPDLVVEVRPKVPMRSVLFLVSYATDAVFWHQRQPEFEDAADFAEIIGIILANVVAATTRRGLLNGYRGEDESIQSPRGRILFDEQIRRRLGVAPPVECCHDVFTADILENRLLLAALLAMSRLHLQRSRIELTRARRLFGAVREVHFPSAAVPDVVFTRLNRHYQAALALATLVLRSASLDLGSGRTRGSAFLVDMNEVFESFIRRALRAALAADGASFPEAAPPIRLDQAGAVPLRPDLCLIEDRRVVWVGDAKYKRLPAGAFRNADLYQLLSYSVALDLPGGMLIYAADEGVTEAEHVVVHAGKRLRVVALNLQASSGAILGQVSGIAKAIQSARPSFRGASANVTTLLSLA